jgi:hypothetical protein
VANTEHTVADPLPAALSTVLVVENLSADAPLHQSFLTRSRRLRHHLAELLREGVAAGELKAGIDAGRKAQEIVAFLEGQQLLWLLDPEEIDLVALCRTYVEGLVGQIAATSPRRPA